MAIPDPLRTIIFDLDGTLTDSRPGILGCLEAALRAHNVAWEGSLAWFIGPPAGQSFVKLLPNSDPAFRAQVLKHYRACYAVKGWTENQVYPGVPELLTMLRERGVDLYLCTSKRVEFTQRILDHFGLAQFFSGVAADSAASENHDKADLLRELLEEHAIDRAGAVMVGDREFDNLAARAVGVASIAVRYGFGSAEELAKGKPDATCDTVEALADLLLARVPEAVPECGTK